MVSLFLDFVFTFRLKNDGLSAEYKAENENQFSQLSERAANSFIVKNMKHLKRTDDISNRPVTVWIVADLESKDGQELYGNAIKSLVRLKCHIMVFVFRFKFRIQVCTNSDSDSVTHKLHSKFFMVEKTDK